MGAKQPNVFERGALFWLKAVLLALFEYIPLLLTIGFATYVALTTTDPSTKQGTLLQWIVVLIGLLATSLTVERIVHLRNITRSVSDISALFSTFMSERIRATDFFLEELPKMKEEIGAASNILVVAVNGETFLVEHKNALAERVAEGAQLRVVAVDPNGKAPAMIANPEKELTTEYLQATAQIAKQTLTWIERQRQGKGQVELRNCDHVPMFAAYAFDRKSPRGKLVLGLYRQFWTHVRRPHAILTRVHDGYWYEFYCEQIEEIWECGTPISLAGVLPPIPAEGTGV